MLGISAASMIIPHFGSSPWIRSVMTPVDNVRCDELEMNVNAYTNSFKTSDAEKMTTVRIPGIEIGKTIRHSVPSRDAPSTCAASSSSCGIVLKKPIRSHVENGNVNDGYTRIKDQSRSSRCSRAITAYKGMKSNVGGTRYVRKMPMPRLW